VNGGPGELVASRGHGFTKVNLILEVDPLSDRDVGGASLTKSVW
jgi:hypothetical protein